MMKKGIYYENKLAAGPLPFDGGNSCFLFCPDGVAGNTGIS
jgi:hypothetical protein